MRSEGYGIYLVSHSVRPFVCLSITTFSFFVFKKMNNSEISHHPVHPFPMVEINSNLYPDLAYDSTLCLQWCYIRNNYLIEGASCNVLMCNAIPIYTQGYSTM